MTNQIECSGWVVPFLRHVLENECGVSVLVQDRETICSRLGEIAKRESGGSVDRLCSRLGEASGADLKEEVVSALLNHETRFFRDPKTFEVIGRLAGAALKGASRTGRFRIWSAACSKGQEAYSAVIALAEVFPDFDDLDIAVIATDVSSEMVGWAQRGIYDRAQVSRGLPPDIRERYFDRSPEGWRVNDRIRERVLFQRVNLLDEFSGLGRFDIILLKNVLIYFSDEQKADILSRAAGSLSRGGSLLIGGTESITGICGGLRVRKVAGEMVYSSGENGVETAPVLGDLLRRAAEPLRAFREGITYSDGASFIEEE